MNVENRVPLMDSRFDIMSYDQYLIDLEEKKFTKMCMTEVINADMMIATFGEEKYNRTCREILHGGNAAYEQMGLDKIIHVYVNTYKHFMAVANDDMSDADFLALMKGAHEQYEIVTATKTELRGVSRFCVAFGDELVDKVKSTYYLNRHLQNNFIVATDERERIIAHREKSVEIFEILDFAINNARVVPFYQAIHNNKTNGIDKYEALMRIYDKDGKLFAPGMFLEAAKTFKLYIPLSKMMIDRALLDFEDKEATLGINISLHDIQSDDFIEWFFARIKMHPDPAKITVEFVETENYNNDDRLTNFLMEVRKIGCKIAVDDFGVGFATYTSIVSLAPDVIKIDGDIISKLDTVKENRMILDSICYMAKLIGSKTVAEFVENEEIQKIAMEYGIDYSQGYYYAKPVPISEI